MQLRQKRFSNKTSFDFAPESVTFAFSDSRSSGSFTVPYMEIAPRPTQLEEKNDWWRNAGALWVVIGIAHIYGRYSSDGVLGGSLWLTLGVACLVAYRFARTSYSLFDTSKGRLFVIHDRLHTTITRELLGRRRKQFLDRYGDVDFEQPPEREVEKFRWLAEHEVITPEERDQRIASVLAVRNPIAMSGASRPN